MICKCVCAVLIIFMIKLWKSVCVLGGWADLRLWLTAKPAGEQRHNNHVTVAYKPKTNPICYRRYWIIKYTQFTIQTNFWQQFVFPAADAHLLGCSTSSGAGRDTCPSLGIKRSRDNANLDCSLNLEGNFVCVVFLFPRQAAAWLAANVTISQWQKDDVFCCIPNEMFGLARSQNVSSQSMQRA